MTSTFIYEELPIAAVGGVGSTANLSSILTAALGSNLDGYSSFWVAYDGASWLQSFNPPFSYWDPSHPVVSSFSLNGINIGASTASNFNQQFLTAAQLSSCTLNIGNDIAPCVYVTVPISIGNGTPTEYIQYEINIVTPTLISATATNGAPNPSDIVASAQRFAAAYSGVLNNNDCHFIAGDVAAAAGATFDNEVTGSTNPALNESAGFWRVAYRGSDPNPVTDWQALVQPGDIVRMGWTGGGQHTTTVLSVNNDGSLTVFDNADTNSQGQEDVGIHTVNYYTQTIPGSITIYRLSPDHLYLINGTDLSETLNGSQFNNQINTGAGNDIVNDGPGNDTVNIGAGNKVINGNASGHDTVVFSVQLAAANITDGSGHALNIIHGSLIDPTAGPIQVSWSGGIDTLNNVSSLKFADQALAVTALPNYTFTTLTGPSGGPVEALGINDGGQIVGVYNGGGGYLLSGGNYTILTGPSASNGDTQPFGINNSNQIVGTYYDSSFNQHGFIYNGGTYTTIDVGYYPKNWLGTKTTEVYGINDAGQIVGAASDNTSSMHGFIDSGGIFTSIDVPSATNTYATGIDNNGDVVGYFVSSDNHYHGFLYSGGTYTILDDPASTTGNTLASGINDLGQIVGTYGVDSLLSGGHGFIYSGGSAGTYVTLDDPSGTSTQLEGINNSGEVVGTYQDNNGSHAFDATTTGSVGTQLSGQVKLSAATEGVAASTTIASFSDTNTSDTTGMFTASINWGDGTTTAGTVSGSNGSFTVTVPSGHIYADEGNDSLVVTVTDTANNAQVVPSGTVTVGEGDALTPHAVTINANQNKAFTGTVATFTDTYANNVASDFTATINWGDGTNTAGTVGGGSGALFTVSGTHTYTAAGTDNVTVTLIDDAPGTATAAAVSTANVTAQLSGHVALTTATEGVAASTSIASFTDTITSDTAGIFTASINWGDGTTPTTGIVSGSNGNFTVTVPAGHIYSDWGSDPLVVTIADTVDGANLLMSGQVTVTGNNHLTGIGQTLDPNYQQFTGQVASFTDTDLNTGAGQLTATINWGDGTAPTTGTVNGGNGTFTVSGTHTYQVAGTDNVTVTLTDHAPGTATATAHSTANVAQGNPIDVAVDGPEARQAFGVTGAGITIGIISDSFNFHGGEQSAINAGLLPQNVNVLPGYGGSGKDEGLAMAEVVHAIAPSSNIDFATGTGSQQEMANAITALQQAGCQIIVDDVGWWPPEANSGSPIESAINAAVQDGVSYFTAAGNNRLSNEATGGPPVPIYGHAVDPNAITVGAIFWYSADSTLTPQTQNEFFSSQGASAGKPNISAPDGGPTSNLLVNSLDPGTFYGTSAAAPAAAAVAALLMQAHPLLEQGPGAAAEVDNLLQKSAIAFGDPSVSGAGLIQAYGALQIASQLIWGFIPQGPYNHGHGPVVAAAAISNTSGEASAGSMVQFVVTLSEGVAVTGGAPVLTLNDGGTARYDASASIPSMGMLVFDYSVGSNDHTSNVSVSGITLPSGSSIQDSSGTAADFSTLLNAPTSLSVNSPLVVTSVTGSQTGEVQAGQTVKLTLTLNEGLTINTAGGTPTLTLNNDAIANYDANASVPAIGKLVFDYTVGTSDGTPSLSIFGVSLPTGTTVQDANGYNADFSAALNKNIGLQVGPAFVDSFVASETVIADTGQTVQLTLVMTTGVTVHTAGGSPTLSLNDGAIATYDTHASNPSTGTLVFDYTVGSHDQTPDLLVTQFNPNGASILDTNGVNIDTSGAVNVPTGLSINSPLLVTSVSSSHTGQIIMGQSVQLALTLNEAVQDNSVDNINGPPTLTLNDGATATYDAAASNLSNGKLVFDYTVGAGEHTPILEIMQVNINGEGIADAQGNLPDFSAALNVPTNLQVVIPPTASTDLYIAPAGTALSVLAASGVLANDVDPNGLTLSATLDQTTAHGALVLNPNGSFSYTPEAGFVGTDSFTYTASDGSLSSAPTTASIVVGSLNALTSPEQLLTELYVGYYDRAPDVPGLNYWLNNYNTPPAQSPGGVNLFYQNLGQAAASFADPGQTETVTLYPFLADPGAASYSDVVTFVDAAYGNLFNRTADTLGEEYWATSIAKSLGIAVPTFGIAGIDNDLPVTAANALLALINGAVSNDAQTIANKVTAGLYYYDMLAANNVAATQASAHAAFAGVTDDPATVLASEAVTNAFVQAALHPSAASAALATVATVGILDSAQSFQVAA